MIKVILDTSFLIHLATKNIKNIDRIEEEIGNLSFVVPTVVINELEKLEKNPKKKFEIKKTKKFTEKLEKIQLDGTFADIEILNYVKKNSSFVGTMDIELKKQIKKSGGSIISLRNNNIILEN